VLRFKVIDSIDRIQGQQSDLVLISFCRTVLGRRRELTNYGLWLQDVRRLNVACTRARRAIVLVGHRDTLAGLRGVQAAERFYANLMEVFTPSNPDAVVLRQLDEAATR
jgi:superfamily I DNA and/or RNA helicase